MTLLEGPGNPSEAQLAQLEDRERAQEKSVERLLVGFLRSMLDEKRAEISAESARATENAAYVEFGAEPRLGGHS